MYKVKNDRVHVASEVEEKEGKKVGSRNTCHSNGKRELHCSTSVRSLTRRNYLLQIRGSGSILRPSSSWVRANFPRSIASSGTTATQAVQETFATLEYFSRDLEKIGKVADHAWWIDLPVSCLLIKIQNPNWARNRTKTTNC